MPIHLDGSSSRPRRSCGGVHPRRADLRRRRAERVGRGTRGGERDRPHDLARRGGATARAACRRRRRRCRPPHLADRRLEHLHVEQGAPRVPARRDRNVRVARKGGSATHMASGRNVYAAVATKRLRPSVANDPSFVYVPNGLPGTVEVIDPKTFRIVRTIDLGYRSFPEHVTPSWDMRWLYVDVDGTNELAVIDPRTGKLARIIHGVEHPYNLYFTPDGSKAIDVAEYYDRIDFIDPHTWKLIKPLTLPCNGPDHLDFSADGSYLLIGCEFDWDGCEGRPEDDEGRGNDPRRRPSRRRQALAERQGLLRREPGARRRLGCRPCVDEGAGVSSRRATAPTGWLSAATRRSSTSRTGSRNDLGDRLLHAEGRAHVGRRREPGHGAGRAGTDRRSGSRTDTARRSRRSPRRMDT